jgi:acetylornithine/succinyldiaminopimelate/putrescine aminotransferase
VSFNRSFHGRSLAMIAATGNPAVRVGFEPQVPGFSQVDLGDLEALSAAIEPETAAVIVEPIQGEGGIWPVPLQFMLELRRICTERQITLIFDEVWTGCGRTGRWFGHQHYADAMGRVIEPDIMTMGKAVGGGLPVGVMFAKPELAALLTPGKHGCTLGGNPICMAAARTIFDVIERDGLLARAQRLGRRAIELLRTDRRILGRVQEVRGQGLFLGIDLAEEPQKIVERAMELGVLVNLTSKKVIRLAPPLTISDEQWEQGLDLVCRAIAGS